MSIATRFYEFCYGSLLPGDQPLNLFQWRQVTRRAQSLVGWKRELPIAVTLALVVYFGLLRTFLITTTAFLSPVWWGCVVPLIWVFMMAIQAWLVRQYVRRAAVELGYIRLCLQCGYSLKGLPEGTINCPECGAETPAARAAT